MFKSIAEDVKREFAYGNKVTQLIIINCAVFVLMLLIKLTFNIAYAPGGAFEFIEFTKYLSVSSSLVFNVTHPWVIITYMFLHVGFWHFAINMLYLFWFGRITGDLLGDKRIVAIYLLSGIAGALLFLISAPVFYPNGAYLLGASASVMGVLVAAIAVAPNYIIHLLFLGPVKLKYIGFVLILLDLVAISAFDNTGGHIAHLGGMMFGWLFIVMVKNGNDLSIPVNNILNWITGIFKPSGTSGQSKAQSRKSLFVRSKVKTEKGKRKTDKTPTPGFQERLDQILEKIKASGYESLTAEEKEFLFQASKRNE